MCSTKGEIIEQKLSELTKKVGRPIQIIADHGSDIQKGIKLYQEKYLETSGQAFYQTAKGHYYSVEIIQIAVQQVINCGTSLRGVEKTFELYVDFCEQGTPSFSSIRKWLGRIGLYELNREKEYRSDWI
ncbi:hypothetical protein N0Y54_09625 [Nostoc punctiforme UO1]